MRITTDETGKTVRFRLEGKLSGPWVAELERVIDATVARTGHRKVVVDVNGLSGADAAGRVLLSLLQQAGAAIQGADPLSASLLSVGSGDVESMRVVKN